MSDNNSAFSFKLSHQGLLLVAVLLVIEFIFVGSLLALLNQAESEARSQDRLRRITVASNRLIELHYVAMYSVRDFITTHDTFHEKKYLGAIRELKENLTFLENNLSKEPYQYALIKKIRTKFNVVFEVADRARDVIGNNGSLAELADVLRNKDRFQALNRELVPDFQELMRGQRRIEDQSPVLQKKWRDNTRLLLGAGLVLNVVIAVAMAVFFTRNIIKRLEVLVDNTRRLKHGENLLPAMYGSDEIAKLDNVFHEMAFDLTEAARKEKLALSDAQEAEQRIRQLINSMPTGILTVDKSGTIMFANPRASSMFGYTTSDLKGLQLSKILSSFDLKKVDGGAMQHIYEDFRDRSVELRATTASGSQLDIDFSITPFDSKGDKRFLLTLVDITEKLEIQKMRQAFVAMVSHELRTPLNSVQGYLEILEMGVFGELTTDARDGAVRASANIDRLISLITDLLDLEKIESGTINLVPEQCDVDETLSRSVEAVEDLAELKKIKIETLPFSDHLTFYCDQDRVIQVVVNFLSNALKFTPDGGTVEIAVNSKAGDSKFVEISVIDQGPGIQPRYREIIFERFQQIRDEDGKHKGGTGLGLAICKAIVEQHHGTIGVDCEREKGSRFWFTIPVSSTSDLRFL
jgi:PAS domain S-box-containing protein